MDERANQVGVDDSEKRNSQVIVVGDFLGQQQKELKEKVKKEVEYYLDSYPDSEDEIINLLNK